MLFPRFWPHLLVAAGMTTAVIVPARADAAASPVLTASFARQTNEDSQSKKKDGPSRPKPSPGPRDGGDDN